ncbi:MAG: hypothetical protein J5525_13000 [Lachnospiraceae bacterium]|nr:hypothetical protein [Lachnospiraceae bacterium]
MKRAVILNSWIRRNIIMRLTDNAAIKVFGLVGGIKYMLGLAKEGVDFI